MWQSTFYYDKVDGKLYPNAYDEIFHYMVKRVREDASTVKVADEYYSQIEKSTNAEDIDIPDLI